MLFFFFFNFLFVRPFSFKTEANVHPRYQEAIKDSRSDDTVRSDIYTGRPIRALNNAYIRSWHKVSRAQEKQDLLSSGVVPFYKDLKDGKFHNGRNGGKKGIFSPIPGGYKDVRALPDEGRSTGVVVTMPISIVEI